jgi:hypothetical protein
MRIWTVHPGYLDTAGLVAVWREALLAQKVLQGQTKGYRNHPQLRRFKEQADPIGAVAAYLGTIHNESVNRGYKFGEDKISAHDFDGYILCTHGQLLYEWRHLKSKLKSRDARKYSEIEDVKEPAANPVFTIVDGNIEDWEVVTRQR